MKGLQMKAGLHAIKSHTLNQPLSSLDGDSEMKDPQIKAGLQTVKSKNLNKPAPLPRRLMGFREWCEKVWEPSKLMRDINFRVIE